MILALSIYTSLLQGILYLFFGVFSPVFGTSHGFNLWQVGLTFLGLLIGNSSACLHAISLQQRSRFLQLRVSSDQPGRLEHC